MVVQLLLTKMNVEVHVRSYKCRPKRLRMERFVIGQETESVDKMAGRDPKCLWFVGTRN